jgi:predicted metal-dependent hydrolase
MDGKDANANMTRPTITPRKPPLGFEKVPKHWFAGLAVPTHISNGVNLLFPHGERFFVRSVYHFLDQIDDADLKAAVKGFGNQEGRHARAHEDYFDTLRAQGYEIDRFLEFYGWLTSKIENASPAKLRLATTAAAEHFTAIMAEGAATEMPLDLVHPQMRQLLLWHAAEELEHKSVAFDVLQKVDPSYALRIAGMAMATIMLSSWWTVASLMLLRQDGIGPLEALRRMRAMREAAKAAGQKMPKPIGERVFGRGLREYFRRDFHPDKNDNYHLAGVLLARSEAAHKEAAAHVTH